MKAHFSFDPMKDRLLPCKEAGLPFTDGDILEILSTDDTNWWQVIYFSFKSMAFRPIKKKSQKIDCFR